MPRMMIRAYFASWNGAIRVSLCMSIHISNKAILDITLRPRSAIQPPHSPTIGRIACAQKCPDYYLRLPGVLNDHVYCMICYWRLHDRSLLQWTRQWQRPLQRRLPMLLNCRTTHKKFPLPLAGSAPPSNTWFRGPTRVFNKKRHVDRFGRFCTAHRRVSRYFTMGHYVFSQKMPLPLGYLVPHLTHGT